MLLVDLFEYSIENGTHWVCTECADIIPHNRICPNCGRNRVILIAEQDARKLLDYIIDLEDKPVRLHTRDHSLHDKYMLTPRGLEALGLTEDEIARYQAGDLIL